MPIRDARTDVIIFPERDATLTPFARKLLEDFYLRPGETPQEGYARAAKAWSGGKDDLAQRLYEAVSKGWFMFASPVLSNAPLPGEKVRGLPISCFLTYVPDTLDGLIDHTAEVRWLSVLGGGVGGFWSDVRGASNKSPGAIPFIKTMDSDMEAYRQGRVRRGSYAAYLDVSHPDVVEFISLRKEGSGDETRKCHSTGFHHAVNITDDFMQAVVEGRDWNLIDPNDKTVRDTLPARQLWEEILETRYRTGEPYLLFIDTAMRAFPQAQKNLGLKIRSSNLCSEIVLATAADRTAVCCLSSLNAERYDEWKGTTLVYDLIEMLDNVLQYFIDHAPDTLAKAKYSAMRERSLGLGVMGFHSYLQGRGVAFESEEAREINREMFHRIKFDAATASLALGAERGVAPDLIEGGGSPYRNTHLLAIAPNANSAILLDTAPSVEPNAANAYVHDTRAGTWAVKNRSLERLLERKGKNTEAVWQDILLNQGSVQHLDFLSDHEKAVFKTAIELDQMWVVQHAADRQPSICQAQSINLFFPPRADRAYLNRVHMAAWEKGLKALYYSRSRAKNRADSVSVKIERVALQDAAQPMADPAEGGCSSCEG